MTVDQKSPHAVRFTKPSDLEFKVERVFDHPIERVWAAYTDPALIPQWWGQGTTVDRLDVRAGGGYRFVSNPGTDKESAVSGDFLEVNPPDRLVQTFGMEGYGKPMTQTIELERAGDGTRLAITSRFDTMEERDGLVAYGAEKGAIGGLARLDAMLKRLAAG
ncbi:MAG: SRPBCC domain-containing protein [Chloroflexota bacterium]|nr:SRPBCC domain-containing protein [Chloroflexota bacterium]